MADEQIRDLERQAALGDDTAQQRLIAIRNRTGLSSLHADYFKEYLELTDELVAACEAADCRNETPSDEYEEYGEAEGKFYSSRLSEARWCFRGIITPFIARLTALNEKFLALGLDKGLLRHSFPAQNALTMDTAWYNSSCY